MYVWNEGLSNYHAFRFEKCEPVKSNQLLGFFKYHILSVVCVSRGHLDRKFPHLKADSRS